MDEILFSPNEVFGLIGLSIILGIVLMIPVAKDE